jgi:hypothetical protein
MFKVLFFSIILIFMASFALAADVDLKWDASAGATGYKIQKSLDQGVTWAAAIDVGNVITYRYLSVEENVLVLFRATAYNANGESIRTWSGAWFDQRKKPVSSPSGQGIQ